MADLRRHLADYETAARRLIPRRDPIPITRTTNVGQLLRDLRHRAGHSQTTLARLTHISKSGIAAREQKPGMNVAAFIDHAHALGYHVTLTPDAGSKH
jgi:DNA-binding XRE family transcriptional regulator